MKFWVLFPLVSRAAEPSRPRGPGLKDKVAVYRGATFTPACVCLCVCLCVRVWHKGSDDVLFTILFFGVCIRVLMYSLDIMSACFSVESSFGKEGSGCLVEILFLFLISVSTSAHPENMERFSTDKREEKNAPPSATISFTAPLTLFKFK